MAYHKYLQTYFISYYTSSDNKNNRKRMTVQSKDNIYNVLDRSEVLIKRRFPNAGGFCISNLTQSE
jgi:hypothetical protein